MAMFKYGAASIVEPGISTDQWIDQAYKTACSDGHCRLKTARSIIAKYDPRKYLLTHCSIIAAVDTDLADLKNPKSDYLIKPEYSKFVNNNGDAWTKKMLEACYRTFIGANNYLEHVQIPALSKGKVIDAVLREIPIGKDSSGKELTTYYVDILVATDRKHSDLVRKIESRELQTLSMGCLIAFSICSKCGNRAVDETQACSCIRYEKNNYFFDQNGIRRRIAELCGHYTEPESVRFIDASWVKNPAFTGAVLRNVVDVPADIMAKLEHANNIESFIPKGGEFIKAASELIAQESPREREETPPEEVPETPTEAPAEGVPTEEAPPEGTSTEEIPTEEIPTEEAGGPEELTELTPEAIKKWKTTLKKQLLNELGKEITETLTKPEEEPQALETLDESIIKPASVVFKKIWGAKRTWDHYLKQTAGKLSKKNFNKLRYGTYILLTSNDSRVLSDFGYTKRDFLAVLSYLDSCSKNPLPVTIKKVLAEMGGTNKQGPVDLLKHIVGAVGRKISKEEARRSLIWLKMMDAYDNKA